jgi:hypothetical protein
MFEIPIPVSYNGMAERIFIFINLSNTALQAMADASSTIDAPSKIEVKKSTKLGPAMQAAELAAELPAKKRRRFRLKPDVALCKKDEILTLQPDVDSSSDSERKPPLRWTYERNVALLKEVIAHKKIIAH